MARDHESAVGDAAARVRIALVRGLRELAERIEEAPLARLQESLPWLATSSAMLAREVGRVLGE